MTTPSPTPDKLMRGPRAHSVAWMLHDDWLEGVVVCHCGEGADCRMDCTEGCESWDLVTHEHPMKDTGRCLFVEWIDAEGVQDSHVGSHAPKDDYITPEWDGDHYTWTYSDV